MWPELEKLVVKTRYERRISEIRDWLDRRRLLGFFTIEQVSACEELIAELERDDVA